MENFIVSARKYRPDNFRSVVGQASITNTLKNAIKNNQLGHAHLFSGPRGVGKTTCARIFAKTINCQHTGSDLEACNTCESCTSFNENRAYNIHELDAASNNSVDDIRSLTEKVRIPPQVGKYSVYIIDEVHMLSAAAFNAFLKTLEEPPRHAIFILATTEKHKIIPTILSRCQIYDFNRIRTEDAVEYLKYIAGQEKVEFEDEALHVIAQKAEGAMRDALSIFDQVVSFSENKITYQSVIENLNILAVEYYFKLTDAFMNNDLPGTLVTFNDILKKGFDARNFLNGLATHLRDLLVAKNKETLVLLDVSEGMKSKYLEQAAAVPAEFLFEALNICNEADQQFRFSKNQRLTIELALVKLANLTMVQKKKIADGKAVEAEKKSAPTPSPNQGKQVAAKTNTPVAESSVSHEKPGENSSNGNGRENQVVHTKSVSIKNILKAEPREIPVSEEEIDEVDQVSSVPEPLPVVDLSEKVLIEAWNAYALTQEKSHPRIYNTLMQHKPGLTGDGKISIELTTNAQRDNFIHYIKPGLVKYLQEHVANIEYVFETNLLENEGVVKKVYTDHDKLEYLIDKNRELEKLKTRFNLDFDN